MENNLIKSVENNYAQKTSKVQEIIYSNLIRVLEDDEKLSQIIDDIEIAKIDSLDEFEIDILQFLDSYVNPKTANYDILIKYTERGHIMKDNYDPILKQMIKDIREVDKRADKLFSMIISLTGQLDIVPTIENFCRFICRSRRCRL